MNIINKYKEKTGVTNKELAAQIGLKDPRQLYKWTTGRVKTPSYLEIMLSDKLQIMDLYEQIKIYRELLRTKLNSEAKK